MLEISYLGESGDEEDPPETRYTKLSEERMARLVARLEETSFRNALLDDGDPVLPDAHRDHVFERLAPSTTPQPMLAVVPRPGGALPTTMDGEDLALVLVGCQKAGSASAGAGSTTSAWSAAIRLAK